MWYIILDPIFSVRLRQRYIKSRRVLHNIVSLFTNQKLTNPYELVPGLNLACRYRISLFNQEQQKLEMLKRFFKKIELYLALSASWDQETAMNPIKTQSAHLRQRQNAPTFT